MLNVTKYDYYATKIHQMVYRAFKYFPEVIPGSPLYIIYCDPRRNACPGRHDASLRPCRLKAVRTVTGSEFHTRGTADEK